MTRQGLLQLIAGAPLAAISGWPAPTTSDGKLRLHLGPGQYMIGAGGGISVFEHAVRIERCTFEGCTIKTADAKDAADRPLSPG
jgi:hypothetical protein